MDVGQILSLFDGSLGVDVARQSLQEGAAQMIVSAAKSLWTLLPAPAKPRLRLRGMSRWMRTSTWLASVPKPGRSPKPAPALTKRVRQSPAKSRSSKNVSGKRK